MRTSPGRKQQQNFIEGEAYRRIMSGEAPATLTAFAQQLLDWYQSSFPDAAPITRATVENQICHTWHRRHEMIRGGDP